MAKSLYLVNPRSGIPTHFGAEVFERWDFQPAQASADLTLVTVAALTPSDWDVTVCDEHLSPVDFDHPADFIGITGKVAQEYRMIELADEFRRRGKTVIIGGPYASLSPDDVRGHCDVLVLGELEGIAEEFFADLDAGSWKQEYKGDKPDIADSPVPRWDLYPNDRALLGAVQTSRGCPFECEFCDVIQYLGRKQRHKSVEQVVAELDVLYSYGYRSVLLSDDNLTVYRSRAKELLAGLRDWNRAREEPVAFGTQLSIDASGDPEIMRLMAECGMSWVFIGIETPNLESLKETKKRQNVGVDLIREIEVFLEHGIAVVAGMIVGFDHDNHSIFDLQLDFAQASPVPIFNLNALAAPASTPLHERMERDGRLVDLTESHGSSPWHSNITPAQMTGAELTEGMHWLCNQMYSPANFGRRVLRMIETMGPQRGPLAQAHKAVRESRPVEREAVMLLKKFFRKNAAERQMFFEVSDAMAKKPGTEAAVIEMLYRYAQVRYLYEVGGFWRDDVAAESPFRGRVAVH
ncbi:MAG: radical SAM protein [Planctomycetota bacterium]